MPLPSKTIVRLGKYRKVLMIYKELQSYYIFSHDLATKLRINPVHIRRDLMLIGFTGNFRHGYSVADLIHRINEVLLKPQSLPAAIIGMGKSGQFILEQIQSSPFCPVYIPVTFDIELANTNRSYSNIPCHNLVEAPAIIQQNNIRIAILSTQSFELQEIVDSLIPIGIENFINCTSEIINVPKHITLRELNIISLFDELGYSISHR